MKLVETDIVHDEDDAKETATPPRPEHRRVYVSLFVTLSVLAATVAVVYALFPKRDNEMLTVAFAAHEDPGVFELEHPSRSEIEAWSVRVVGRGAPWPEENSGIEPLGTRSLEILGRPAALVRYRVAASEVTVVAMRARVVPARKYRRYEGDLYAVSWREGKWTLVAVGPESSAETWGDAVGIP